MFKKIYLAIDVTDDAQRERLQRIADELSNARLVNGNQLENIYPVYRKYETELRQLFHNVSRNGFGAQTMVSVGKLASRMLKK